MKQPSILILNWRDPKHPLAGGAEQMLLQHALYWIKNGCSVSWFSSEFKSSSKRDLIDGIKIYRGGNHFTVSMHAFLFFLKNGFKGTDVVIDCFHFFPFFSPLYFRKTKKIALIQEIAGTLWFENLFFPLSLVGYIVEPLIFKLYKQINFITGAESTKNELIRIGIKKKKIHVIHHGISKYKKINVKKEKNPVLIFLGRVSHDKGIEDALMTLSLLVRDYKDLKLWIVGKSESKKYEKRVKRLTKEFEVSKSCIWYGFVSEEKKYQLLAKAWILIHPSKKEGWGLNVIEANSVRTPAVGYKVEGLQDSILDKKTGLLVDPDSLSMADGVELLIQKKKIFKKISDNAYAWSKEFSWKKAGSESYKLISDILSI